MRSRGGPALAGCGLLVAVLVIAAAGPGRADHWDVEVSAPESAALGERVVLTASVREATTGDPVEGAELVFFSTVGFAGVSGDVELGEVFTNDLGIAVFNYEIRTLGTHTITVEGGAEPVVVSFPVTIGGQLVRPQAPGVIPGIGSWVVTVVIGAVWAIMLIAGVGVARVAFAKDGRAGTERLGWLNTGTFMTGAMVLVAGGILALLFRSPYTQHNFDPEGYRRSAVAYVEGAYAYPDFGLAPDIVGNQAELGRGLFLTKGCAGCHGVAAEGTTTAGSPAYATYDWLRQVVRTGLPGMPSYSEFDLNTTELNEVFAFLAEARSTLPEPPTTAPPAVDDEPAADHGDAGEDGSPTFVDTIAPIFTASCAACHGAAGGWSADDYDAVMTSGDNAPVVIAGDPDQSLLAQKVLGTQTVGAIMPPAGLMAEEDIQAIVDWIAAGAPEQ